MIFPAFIAFLTFSAIGIILNGIGLFLLFNCNNLEIDLTQRYILINLCFIDFSLSLSFATDRFLYFNYSKVHSSMYCKFTLNLWVKILSTGFYFATFWLIIDRYLHIKLNIRYIIYWSKKKTVIGAIVLWMVMTWTGILYTVYEIYFDLAFYVIFDSIILIFSSYVYAYALILFKMQRANIRSNQRGNGMFKGLALSVAIITAFSVFVAIPDALYAIYQFDYSEKTPWYMWIFYPISMWTDSLVYIFLSPKVRLAVKEKLKRVIFNRSVFTESNELYYIPS